MSFSFCPVNGGDAICFDLDILHGRPVAFEEVVVMNDAIKAAIKAGAKLEKGDLDGQAMVKV